MRKQLLNDLLCIAVEGRKTNNDGKIFRLLNKCFISFIISLVKMNIKKGKQLMPDGHFKADALSHFHIGLMLQNRGVGSGR